MAKFGKWLGGGLGWAFGGPLGGFIGFALGSLFDTAAITNYSTDASGKPQTYAGDFHLALLALTAAIIKADGKVLKSEIDYVKQSFVKSFGVDKTRELMLILKDILDKDIPLQEICLQIKHNMQLAHRLELIHLLYGISMSDSYVHPKEIEVIELIGHYLGINPKDMQSIRAMFYKDVENDYKVLEIDKSVSDEEVKKAYRKMAVKYHPDKVSQLGEDVQKAANEKFQRLQQAYENIKKERGLV